jgi:phage shock protein A
LGIDARLRIEGVFEIQRKDLVRLDRILGLLSSDHPGERASAALAATNFINKHDLTWWEVLEGKALGAKAAAAVRRADTSVDYLKAAESRLRQMQAHNATLEKQIRRLKVKLGELEEE